MDLLLILTYTAFCISIFKIFKLPLNKWTVPTAVLGGIILIGTLIFTMNYNHPYSEISRQYFVSTPIVPAVSGNVIEVPVQGNAHVKKGDILFKLDPTPFQAVVTQKEALLADALQSAVPKLKAGVDAANASVAKMVAERDRAQAEVTRTKLLIEKRLITQRELERWVKELNKWQAAVNEAVAKRTQARVAIEAEVGGENTLVAQVRADLAQAQYKLDQSIVRAPTDGYVIQNTLRPGMRAASLPLRPVMIFIHDESHYYIAWFRQNSLLRLEVGNEAEVAFDGIPGQVFSGEVEQVWPVMQEGQVQASGDLFNFTRSPRPGRIPVLIKITDPDYQQYIGIVPGGAYAQTAIYSEHFHHVAIMRKILLRMSAWMNYIFPFH
ncbi:MAG: HlyD family secretion protein [Piscirickettsiaceae bacterium]|nr:HlyD family secretion protein [Piscirickettsiaceae bacterium]